MKERKRKNPHVDRLVELVNTNPIKILMQAFFTERENQFIWNHKRLQKDTATLGS